MASVIPSTNTTSHGRATASYHAGDADRVDIHYEPTETGSCWTRWATRRSIRRVSKTNAGVLDGISGPICSQGCGQTDIQYSYDAQPECHQQNELRSHHALRRLRCQGSAGIHDRGRRHCPRRGGLDYEYDRAFPEPDHPDHRAFGLPRSVPDHDPELRRTRQPGQ